MSILLGFSEDKPQSYESLARTRHARRVLFVAGLLLLGITWSPAAVDAQKCKPGDFLIDETATNIVCLTASELSEYKRLPVRLREQAQRWNESGDLKGGFADAHACMCEGITKKALAKGFEQNHWVLRLNRAFVDSFFMWLAKWESRTGKGNMPEQWWRAFTWADAMQKDPYWPGVSDPGTARERVTLALAAAHIFHDIPMALRKEGCGSDKDFAAIMDVVNECEEKTLGPFNKMLKDFGTYLGYPGVNAISEWRTAARNSVCAKPVH